MKKPEQTKEDTADYFKKMEQHICDHKLKDGKCSKCELILRTIKRR